MADSNGDLRLPGWWVKIVGATLPVFAIVLVAAVPWAWSVQRDLSSIRDNLEYQKQLTDQTLREISRRVEDHELRLRDVERRK